MPAADVLCGAACAQRRDTVVESNASAGTVSLKIACDSSVVGTLRLYSGTPRVMSSNSYSLPFNLSLTSAAASNDLATLSPGTQFNIARDGQWQTVTLYAKIFARDFKSLPAGLYSTAITLTVEY
jgi:hypothetical protein